LPLVEYYNNNDNNSNNNDNNNFIIYIYIYIYIYNEYTGWGILIAPGGYLGN